MSHHNAKGPVNLNLFAFHFPVTAIVSILHRITGVLLFLGLPLVIWAWQLSLRDSASFSFIMALMQTLPLRLFLWLYLSCLIYHMLAGIRHLFMDLGLGEELATGRYLAWILLALGAAGFVGLFFYFLVI